MDTPHEHLIAALRIAISAREEQPLVRAPKQPGLFASRTGTAGEAVHWAVRDGLLTITRTESKGKAETEWAKITPRGVQYLAQHESPREVLLQLTELLQSHASGLPRWLTDLQAQMHGMQRRLQDFLDQFTAELQLLSFRVTEALKRTEPAVPPTTVPSLVPWQLDLLELLRLEAAADGGPVLLHQLFTELKANHPELTVPTYHEGLLRLRDRGSLKLVAWAGDMASLPEPEFALLEEGRIHYALQKQS